MSLRLISTSLNGQRSMAIAQRPCTCCPLPTPNSQHETRNFGLPQKISHACSARPSTSSGWQFEMTKNSHWRQFVKFVSTAHSQLLTRNTQLPTSVFGLPPAHQINSIFYRLFSPQSWFLTLVSIKDFSTSLSANFDFAQLPTLRVTVRNDKEPHWRQFVKFLSTAHSQLVTRNAQLPTSVFGLRSSTCPPNQFYFLSSFLSWVLILGSRF